MIKQKCCIDKCNRGVAVKKHGLCWAHVHRFYRTGNAGNKTIIGRKIHKPFKGDKSERLLG